MHLAILTQYYAPETGAPQNRLGDLSRRLVERGHHITVATAMPNYPTGRVRPEWRGHLVGREDLEGARVLRSAIVPAAGGGVARQLLAYGSFAASALLTAPFRTGPVDVVMWESPPLFLAPSAWALARARRARLVMNVSDLWPASAVELGMIGPGRTLRAVERLERWAYDTADLVLGQTEGILDGVRATGTATPVALYPNGVDVEAWQPDPAVRAEVRRELGLAEPDILVGYAGNFGRAQAFEQVLEAARRLADHPEVRFRIRGDGPQGEEVRAGAAGLRGVEVLPPVDPTALRREAQAWDLSVVPLADRPLFDGARPSKMFELMALGVPFVFCGRGEGAALAEASGGALAIRPEQPDELAAALTQLIAEGSERRQARADRMRAFAASDYDRATIAGRVEELLVGLGRS
jgi:glycosyltransferase involved in cell wall biosynthesis